MRPYRDIGPHRAGRTPCAPTGTRGCRVAGEGDLPAFGGQAFPPAHPDMFSGRGSGGHPLKPPPEGSSPLDSPGTGQDRREG